MHWCQSLSWGLIIAFCVAAAQASHLVESKAVVQGTSPNTVSITGITDAEAAFTQSDVNTFGISAQAKAQTAYRLNKAIAQTNDSANNQFVLAQTQSFWRDGLTLISDPNVTPTATVFFQFEVSGSLGGNTQSSNVNFELVYITVHGMRP